MALPFFVSLLPLSAHTPSTLLYPPVFLNLRRANFTHKSWDRSCSIIGWSENSNQDEQEVGSFKLESYEGVNIVTPATFLQVSAAQI